MNQPVQNGPVPFEWLQIASERKQQELVLDWVKEQGWRHTVSWSGRPVVDIEEWRRHMVGGEHEQKHNKPDLSWFNGPKTQAS